ncbi:MAG: sterol desaturase family protein [Saprospiraceae bacterium]|jgi:beta-carotene 3-hydroxylase|uniref:Sterol desaturase family protein n=1 Tax=Candidatus Defluviibacterium haderslevense TaxID=2981993 RepID=A0A9D7SBQ6_9BACT|nr:sterol desaturase family protein [Candidatus Defluviibacterium haderslevense]MBK9719700.1 sterol desaturase family protein [Candidatus Defluviibacterium haderslevense]MBL0238152.1 sterol desaturase family protein [Candidatus Defluviibacterium haderslevense]
MAPWLIHCLIVITSFFGMEFIAWFTHKFIMHGLLWSWHEDHHKPHQLKTGFWEKNDRFFLVFAIPSMICYILGTLYYQQYQWLLYIGIGISIYGVAYFLVHDVYIHRRFSWFKHIDNTYSKAILRAHGAHHLKQTKENCESFGMLLVNFKYLKRNRT